MFEVNESFRSLSLSHYGYDGGNLNSKIWVSGLEWGSGIDVPNLLKDIQNGPLHTPLSIDDLERRMKYSTYPFDRIWMKVISKTFGLEVRDYKRMVDDEYRCLTSAGPMMKLNLYPISFKDTSPDYWSKEIYALTGFPTKELYMAWVQTYRFKFFNDLIAEFKPKIVLCSGITYKKDFLLAYGGVDLVFTPALGKINLPEKKEALIYKSQLSPETTIIIVPFFGNIHGVKSDVQCSILGDQLKAFL